MDNVNVAAAINNNEGLALALLGSAASDDKGSLLRQTFSSSVDFEIDMKEKMNTDLLIGMLDPLIAGDHGFEILKFTINVENKTVERTFTDLDTANIFFNDNVENFGLWGDLISDDNVLDISFDFNLKERHSGQGFSVDFIIAAGDKVVVPLPAGIWLFCSGLLGLIVISCKRTRN